MSPAQPADEVHARARQVLDAADVPSIVLKGPSTAELLYAGEVRTYVDADVLIPADRLEAALAVLGAAGFVREDAGMRDGETGSTHSVTLLPGSGVGAPLDLHVTLPGFQAPLDLQWQELWATRVAAQVAGTDVWYLGTAARALVVVTHAARNGFADSTSSMDLRRALGRLDAGVWTQTAELCRRLDATAPFMAGLGLLPAGRELAGRLGLPTASDVEWSLRPQSGPGPSQRILQLGAEPWRRRAILAAGEVLPSAAFMRLDWPAARRGRAGLLLSYAQRLAHLARGLPGTWREVTTARRRARDPEDASPAADHL